MAIINRMGNIIITLIAKHEEKLESRSQPKEGDNQNGQNFWGTVPKTAGPIIA